MLPLSLLRAARDREILIELTNGESYSGKLVSCDSYMNVVLSEVILTSHNGSRFFQLSECYIRGGTIKCMRLSKETLDNVPQEELNSKYNKARVGARKGIFERGRGGASNRGGSSRGNGRGRGRGRGRS